VCAALTYHTGDKDGAFAKIVYQTSMITTVLEKACMTQSESKQGKPSQQAANSQC